MKKLLPIPRSESDRSRFDSAQIPVSLNKFQRSESVTDQGFKSYFACKTVPDLCASLNDLDTANAMYRALGEKGLPPGPVKDLSVALRGYKPLPPKVKRADAVATQMPYLAFFSTLPPRFQNVLASFAFRVLRSGSTNGVFTNAANLRLFSKNAHLLTSSILGLQKDVNEAIGRNVPLTVISLGGSPSYLAAHSMNIISKHLSDAAKVPSYSSRQLADTPPIDQGFLHLPFSGNWFEDPVDGVYPERKGKLPTSKQFEETFRFYENELGLSIDDLTADDMPVCILEQTKTGRGLRSSLDLLERWVGFKYKDSSQDEIDAKLSNLRRNVHVIAFQDPLNQSKYPLSGMEGLNIYDIRILNPIEDHTRQASHDFEGIADNEDGPRLVPSYKPYDHDSNRVRERFKRDRELSTSVLALVTYHLVYGDDALDKIMSVEYGTSSTFTSDHNLNNPIVDLLPDGVIA